MLVLRLFCGSETWVLKRKIKEKLLHFLHHSLVEKDKKTFIKQAWLVRKAGSPHMASTKRHVAIYIWSCMITVDEAKYVKTMAFGRSLWLPRIACKRDDCGFVTLSGKLFFFISPPWFKFSLLSTINMNGTLLIFSPQI